MKIVIFSLGLVMIVAAAEAIPIPRLMQLFLASIASFAWGLLVGELM